MEIFEPTPSMWSSIIAKSWFITICSLTVPADHTSLPPFYHSDSCWIFKNHTIDPPYCGSDWFWGWTCRKEQKFSFSFNYIVFDCDHWNLWKPYLKVKSKFSNLHRRDLYNKTKYIVFYQKYDSFSLSKINWADGSDLDYVTFYKYHLIGFISIFHHTPTTFRQVKARLAFLFRNEASFTHAAKHTLVKMTMQPILDYGDVIKMASSNSDRL